MQEHRMTGQTQESAINMAPAVNKTGIVSTPPTLFAPEPTELPQYYDSEPSSQPPTYIRGANRNTESFLQPNSGASAADISAILAYPTASQLQSGKEKRSWRERWKEWKLRNSDPNLQGVQGSGPTLNVQGVGVKSWTSISPSTRQRRK